MLFTSRSTRQLQGWAAGLTLALVLVVTTGAIATGWIAPRLAGGSKDIGDNGHLLQEPVLEVTILPSETPTQDRSTPTAIDATDGYIPDGEVLSPFDVDHPAIARLDADLLAAVQAAAFDASADGMDMVITSGWRSEGYQQALLDEAIMTYGSEAEARKWVMTPDESAHVSGDAVDIGYTDADYWLIENGYRYGLCQTYANEIWHFELAISPGGTCSRPLADATE